MTRLAAVAVACILAAAVATVSAKKGGDRRRGYPAQQCPASPRTTPNLGLENTYEVNYVCAAATASTDGDSSGRAAVEKELKTCLGDAAAADLLRVGRLTASSPPRTLIGVCNNHDDMLSGSVGTPLHRVSPARYATRTTDGVAPEMAPGIGLVAPRYVSNRLFNDLHHQVHSERSLSEWIFLWCAPSNLVVSSDFRPRHCDSCPRETVTKAVANSITRENVSTPPITVRTQHPNGVNVTPDAPAPLPIIQGAVRGPRPGPGRRQPRGGGGHEHRAWGGRPVGGIQRDLRAGPYTPSSFSCQLNHSTATAALSLPVVVSLPCKRAGSSP